MFRFLFEIITTIGFFIILIPAAIVRKITGKSLDGFKEKMGFYKTKELGDKIIVFHGVSVGEVIALENLIKETKINFPNYKIVVTTGTKTGQDIAKKKYENIADAIAYFPYDTGFSVRKFLSAFTPTVILMAETELWPNFIFECKKKNVPVYLINGRISDSSFKSYKYFKFFFKHILKNYDGIFTQSVEDMEKMIKIGAPEAKTSVMKNLKFDIKKGEKKVEIDTDGGRVIVAGSTHKGENEIIVNAFNCLKKKHKDIKLMLAPRHLKRVPSIISIIEKSGLKYGFRSGGDNFKKNDVIILDTLGELGSMYSICHLAFIGGSFNNTGGHNPLEAIVFNKPVVSGPSVKNFKDIYWLLTRTNAGKIVKTQEEFEEYTEKLLSDENFYAQAAKDCETIFNNQQGAKDFVINKLKEILI